MRGVWLVLILLPLAGCLDDGSSDDEATAFERQPHGTPDRTDGPVATEQRNDRWMASREVVIRNGIGEAKSASVTQESFNGIVTAAGTQDGRYELTATLYAYGDTEQEARQELARLDIVHEDTLTGSTLGLSTTYEIDEIPALPLIGVAQYDGGMDLYLSLDDRPALDYRGDTTNGVVTIAGLSGPSINAATTNGAIAVGGAFDEVDLETSNGVIGGELHRFSEGPGHLTAATSNGAITFFLPTDADHGFDVTGDTSNGFVTLHLAGTDPIGQQSDTHKHVRTTDYDDRAYRTAVDLDTTNGSITVAG